MSARSAEWYRRIYRDASKSTSVGIATGGVDAYLAGKTGHTLYIQHLAVTITTSAAQTIKFQSDAGTALVIAEIPASAVEGVYEWDFGAFGQAIGEGDDLDIAGTAGPGYNVAIDAYWRQTGVLTEAQAASA